MTGFGHPYADLKRTTLFFDLGAHACIGVFNVAVAFLKMHDISSCEDLIHRSKRGSDICYLRCQAERVVLVADSADRLLTEVLNWRSVGRAESWAIPGRLRFDVSKC